MRIIRKWQSGILLILLGFIGTTLAGTPAIAQGGPENVLLVVNSKSETSKLLANHYIALREIAGSHVVYLDEVPAKEQIREEAFREKIVQPILEQIEARKLSDCIDYIVYSSDFPTTITIGPTRKTLEEQAANQNQPLSSQAQKIYSPYASLTSMTYFADQVIAKDPTFMLLNANFYMRNPTDANRLESRSFHSTDIWTPDGELTDEPRKGRRYFISTILNVTRNYGINEQQAVEALNNAVNADSTPPEGTVYFCENKNPRTAPRIRYFKDVIDELNQLGIKTKRIKTVLPTNAQIAGLVAGFPKANLDDGGNRYSHGSICDNLTSIGGKFTSNSQTLCTEFIRKGAAGSNGCVAEPFAIAKKFPHPMIQVHYAKGCTLGEAYYQSIHGPYQNLIVGDPLCRPFGKRPRFEVHGLKKSQKINGTLTIQCEQIGNVEIGKLLVYLDGQPLPHDSNQIDRFDFDSDQFADGYHELTLVAVAKGLVEINSRKTIPININNSEQRIGIQCDRRSVPVGESLRITVETKLRPIHIVHNSRVLASSEDSTKSFEIDTQELGRGPVRIQAIGGDDKSNPTAWSAPISVEIEGELATKVPQPHLPRKLRSK